MYLKLYIKYVQFNGMWAIFLIFELINVYTNGYLLRIFLETTELTQVIIILIRFHVILY